jgi:putative transcriptional regulator
MDFSFKNVNKPAKGVLLLSDPFSHDEHFTRSVVLLCDHNTEGTFGLVLNNYLDFPAQAIHEEMALISQRVSIGGPVDKENIFYFHQFEHVSGSLKVSDKLYFGGSFEEVLNHIKNSPWDTDKVRIFIGYSGWSEGQLEKELENNAWLVVEDYKLEQIMDTHNDSLWKDLMSEQGKKFKLLAEFPLHPEYN